MSQNGIPPKPRAATMADTVCKHCNARFPSARVPIIGQPQQAFMEWSMMLMGHLQTKHPEINAELFKFQAEFGGLLMFMQFSSSDTELLQNQDRTRHRVFKLCQRAYISDATIEEKVDQLINGETSPSLRADVIALVKELRDVLGEAGLYPQSSQIALPGQKLPV